ncbi:MAG TPA: disulfide bond formation protein B [Acidimicrobiia bacterium]|nr:disulfide bond formation protein B [Acidimicrobiia bacterium]
MDQGVKTVSLFLALLAVVAEVATGVAVILAVGGRFSPVLRRWRDQAVDAVGPSALTLAALVAAVCMGGSLYFSEVAHFRPCHLCWLQRFCMYPLVPVLGIAAWRRWARVRPWAGALALVGACISTYHVALEHHPEWESSICDPKNPCTVIWIKRLGYLTIPAMALSGFALIITLLAISRASDRPAPDPDPSELPRSEVHGHP